MKAIAIIVLTAFSFLSLKAQVNGYAQVTAISSTTLTIGTASETYGTFASGLPVIIMQMQDNVIGANTGNNASFGNLSSIQSTGTYEVARITGITRSGGAVTEVTIASPLTNTYNINSNSNVQIITYPLLGANFSTTDDIRAVAWNGTIGGVVAFRVTGTLTLNHNILAENAGFRGGVLNSGNAGSCDNTTYISVSNELNADKGESIYKISNTSFAAGRGKILNGGGGANSHNGGGGGGSNAAAGGNGGNGYGCSSSAGGLGAATLYSLIGSNRVFMGGGGGAGEGNNNFNTAGGNGGGTIIVSANQIVTTGTGAALRISANGQSAADVGNDGAGGGGAGGSVVLNVNSWSIVSTKTLTISSNGGNGGNVTDANAHGGGGGGGQGAIIFKTSTPTTNITSRTLNGTGGRNYAGGTFADNAAGSDNVGIFNTSMAVLPAQIIFFKGKRADNANELAWEMVNESADGYYTVQRSSDGVQFESIGRVNAGSGNYHFSDNDAATSDMYYRIVMNNGNGHAEYSAMVLVRMGNGSYFSLALAPNPVREVTTLKIDCERQLTGEVRVINSLGMLVMKKNISLSKGENTIALSIAPSLGSGVYQVIVNAGEYAASAKMLIRR